MRPTSVPTTAEFAVFIEHAKSILGHSRSRFPIGEFSEFLEASKPLVIQLVRQALKDHQGQLKNLCHWLIPSSLDILAVAGLSGFEDPYTNLIKWMLYPPGSPDLAKRCQCAWLKALGLPVAQEITEAIEPRTQLGTEDGRADMVLHFWQQQYLVIVEAKIGSEEHETPKSSAQTKAYPSAVRMRLGLPDDYPGIMVFLTPDGVLAADASAINTTYDTLVTALACELSPAELPPHLNWAYSTIVTHLLTHAASGSLNKAEALRKLSACLGGRAASLTDEQIIAELGTLGPICRTLEQGAPR
jgi:hypothetical protein